MARDPNLKPIRTVSYAIDNGISPALAAAVMLKESNKAKNEGWDDITLFVRTEPTKFILTLWGVKP